MTKAAVFTMELDPDLRNAFIAAAEASRRPASQVMRELMREFVRREQDRTEHAAFLHHKVEAARASVAAGRGRPNGAVEDAFAVRRAGVIDPA